MQSTIACLLLMVAATTSTRTITDQLNVSGKQKEVLQTSEALCRKYYNIDAERVGKSLDGVGEDDSSPNFVCFFFCVFEKHGSMDCKGKVNYEKLRSFVTEEQFNAIKKCPEKEDGEDDVCDKAYKIHKCFRKNLDLLKKD